jgi:hypothetical protein
MPPEHVVALGASTAGAKRFLLQFRQLLCDALACHTIYTQQPLNRKNPDTNQGAGSDASCGRRSDCALLLENPDPIVLALFACVLPPNSQNRQTAFDDM